MKFMILFTFSIPLITIFSCWSQAVGPYESEDSYCKIELREELIGEGLLCMSGPINIEILAFCYLYQEIRMNECEEKSDIKPYWL